MTDEPTERRRSEIRAAARAADVMVGRIPAGDMPLPVELAEHGAFAVEGRRPVAGVVLHAPHGTPDVLDRYQILFGGALSSVPVPAARDPYTEYRLLGNVPGPDGTGTGTVPFLAVVRVVDGRVPLPRRVRRAPAPAPAPVPGLLPGVAVPRGPADAEAALAHPAPAPAPVLVPVPGAGDGTAEALAVLASGRPLAPGQATQLHDVLDVPPGPAALLRLARTGWEAAPAPAPASASAAALAGKAVVR